MKEQSFNEHMAKLKANLEQQKNSFPKILFFFIISILVVFFLFYNLKERDKKILDLMSKNRELLKDNDRLDSLIYYNNVEIVKKSNEIQGLKDKELGLQSNVKTIENKIKTLKSNYEKANNHADNFSSNQLSRYFADSLR
jgi:chromosome segregation ATPase